jgi:uncharacterized membrane protein YtjA (UPF0391 family)
MKDTAPLSSTLTANASPAQRRFHRQPQTRLTMLKWAIIFGIISLVAAVLGFGGIAGAAAGIAKVLFFIFLSVCVILLIAGIFVGKKLL